MLVNAVSRLGGTGDELTVINSKGLQFEEKKYMRSRDGSLNDESDDDDTSNSADVSADVSSESGVT